MAQSGYTPIALYYSATASNAPSPANLVNGELAINITDGKLYYKDNGGAVQLLASKATATGPAGSNTQVQFNNSGVFGASANFTWNGTTLTASNLGTGGNLTFTGTSGRILGDFSNATFASRTAFQTSTTNASTGIYALPNGTSTAASWQATNAADPTNASKILIATNGSTDVQLVSGINGTGTYLPLSLWNGGAGRFVIGTSGQFGIGPTATVSYGTSGQAFISGGASAAPSWGTLGVSGGGTGQTSFTTGQVLYGNGTGGLSTSANMTFNGTTLTLANDASISGLTVGKGAQAGATCTVFGVSALASNTIGDSGDTAIGYQALNAKTTGYVNVAVGSQALKLNTSGYQNTALGYQTLQSNLSGTNNVAVGHQALSANTASSNTGVGYTALGLNTTGTSNVALGYSALLNNTTASNNTAVGYQAGYSNTTGAFNCAFGTSALNANTTGQVHAAFGASALGANTTGADNSAFGGNTLGANTTGSYNVAVGRFALTSNTTASNNTAVGYQAGYSNTAASNSFFGNTAGYTNSSGAGNTAIGERSLYANTTANFNTAVGSVALYSNTTGASNTAVGLGSLQNNTTASNNTAVGFQAGYSNTTGHDFTFVGYQAGYNNTTGSYSTGFGQQVLYNQTTGRNQAFGFEAGYGITTGTFNQLFGDNAGASVTTGSYNTILGGYSGNQGGLDIRTASNYIVLSDGAGNPRQIINGSGNVGLGTNPASWESGAQVLQMTTAGAGGTSGNFGSIWARSDSIRTINAAYFNGTNYIYAVTGAAVSGITFSTTGIQTFTASSGTAGNTFSVTQGPYVSTNGTSWTNSSDERLKNITGEITNALDKVLQLRAATYTWKADESAKPQVGLIAQDLLKVLPEVVVVPESETDKDGNKQYMGVNYDNVIPLLVAAIQELNAKVTALEAKLGA